MPDLLERVEQRGDGTADWRFLDRELGETLAVQDVMAQVHGASLTASEQAVLLEEACCQISSAR